MSDEIRNTAAERASAEPPPRSLTPQDRVLLLDTWQRRGCRRATSARWSASRGTRSTPGRRRSIGRARRG